MNRPELWLIALAGVIIVAATIIALNGNVVPDWFQILAGAAVGGGAGATLPKTPVP